ncbi:MAG TPA: DUF11 domain-containing protein [Nonomuraea sp.]|nr:DUF11 domain-containing protein [Nonomuraea sp.]
MQTTSRITRAVAALVVAAAGLLSLTSPAQAEAPATQPLTVRILLVSCVDPCRNTGLEAAGESAPDFYGEITFAGFDTYTTPRAAEDQEQVAPFWTLTHDIPTTVVEQDISVLIKDHDSTSGDDWGDASPRADDAVARFKVNLIRGTVSGDMTDSVQCLVGNGEPGGGPLGRDPQPAIQVCIEITPNSVTDSDSDGFTDYEEYRGVDVNKDDIVDLPLQELADPGRRDLFVEVDYMTGREPQGGVLAAVERVFDNAPVTNPQTGRRGLALHLIKDEQVPYAEGIVFTYDGGTRPSGGQDDFDDYKTGDPARPCDGTFGRPQERSSALCQDILQYKRLRFRYGMFINGLTGLGRTSGQAELDDRGGNDFVVSLGRWTTQMLTNVGGLADAEMSTLLHELGHTLGLGHGGRRDNGTVDLDNCKPNYFSVMNYPLQFRDVDGNRPLDFSTAATAPLDEKDALDEIVKPGIAGVGNRFVIHGVAGRWVTHRADGQIDWNGDTRNDTTTAREDIDFIPVYGEDCAVASPDRTMVGRPDWDRLVYSFTGSRYFSDGAHGGVEKELSGDDVIRVTAVDLKAAKTVDQAEATGGQTLTYTVTATNSSSTTATRVTVTDTPPTGEAITRSLADLPPGQDTTQTFTYEVPCAAADGSTITNRAEVAGRTAGGEPEPAETLADNTATAGTVIHAPKIALEQSATPAVDAGAALTYTLAYRNTGGATATGATLTQTLPAGVYYSQALDQGAGPEPGTVARNADGTTTLTWNLGSLDAGASGTVTVTARPSLLLAAGAELTATTSLRYGGTAGCAFGPATAQATTRITQVAPTRNPLTSTLWGLRTDLRTAETLARVQATDQRYDTDQDGDLSQSEAAAALALPLLQPRTLRAELLATLLNLSTRRINAGTAAFTVTLRKIGAGTVAEAARYAQATLALPVPQNPLRYTDATLALTEINSGLAVRD